MEIRRYGLIGNEPINHQSLNDVDISVIASAIKGHETINIKHFNLETDGLIYSKTIFENQILISQA